MMLRKNRKICETNFSTGCICKNSTLNYKTGKLLSFTLTFTGTWQLTVPQGLPETQPRQHLHMFDPHKHHSNKQVTTQYISSVYEKVLQITGTLNMCTTYTHCVSQRSEQVPKTIRNYADSDGTTGTSGNFRHSHVESRYICTAHVITQPYKLDSRSVGLVTAVMYHVTGLTCSFIYGLGIQPYCHPQ
jgi:hypothetical protein